MLFSVTLPDLIWWSMSSTLMMASAIPASVCLSLTTPFIPLCICQTDNLVLFFWMHQHILTHAACLDSQQVQVCECLVNFIGRLSCAVYVVPAPCRLAEILYCFPILRAAHWHEGTYHRTARPSPQNS